jgi:hypothetical protein
LIMTAFSPRGSFVFVTRVAKRRRLGVLVQFSRVWGGFQLWDFIAQRRFRRATPPLTYSNDTLSSGPGRSGSSSYTRCGNTKVAGSPRGSPRRQKIVEHQQEPAPQRHAFRRKRLGEPAGDLTQDRVHQRVDAEDVGG